MRTSDKLYLLLSMLVLTLTACDYLDVVPEENILNIDKNFQKRENAYDWRNTCYVPMVTELSESNDPALLGSDEYCSNDFAQKISRLGGGSQFPALQIAAGNQMAQNPYCNVWKSSTTYWEAIRACNTFLEKIHLTSMKDDEKKLWIGEVKAVKAYYYFDLMRRYGPIPLIDKNHDPSEATKDMQDPRQPIDVVVDTIVKLSDEAVAMLPPIASKDNENVLFFSKESAAYLKAMTLLYAASPLFNGAAMFSKMKNKEGVLLFPQKYDPEKWHKAAVACDEAIEICTKYGLKLNSGSSSMPDALTNTMKDIENTWINLQWKNPEAILTMNAWGQGQIGLDVYCSPASRTQEYSSEWGDYSANDKSCFGAPLKMVEMFYTEHGLPLSEDRQWMADKYGFSKETDSKYRHVLPLNVDVLNLHRRREPRFYAMILCDNSYWYHKTRKGQYDDVLSDCKQGAVNGLVGTEISSDSPQNITGYYIKKWFSTDIRLNNYSKYNTNSFARYVFRLPELYLASAEAWNEYLDKPDQHVYDMIDVVRKRAGVPGVVEAWTNYSRNPEKVYTKEGFRDIIHQEWNIEFMFEGRRFWNLRRWMTAPQEMNEAQTGWNVQGKTTEDFYNNGRGPVKVWTKNKFVAPKDYFFPIGAEEILVSGQTQNVGW